MASRLTFLGTADAFSTGARGHSALLIEDARGRLLVDCGATVPLALKRAGIAFPSIGAVAITHLHGDHIAGLPFLFLGGLYDERRTEPLDVLGPPHAERQVRALYKVLYPDASENVHPFEIRWRETSFGPPLEFAGRRFTPFRMHHMGGEYTALGYRIELADGKVVAVTGDTGLDAPLEDLSAHADLFVCECTMPSPPPGEKPIPVKHVSIADVRRLRSGWSAKRVVLTHVSDAARDEARTLERVEVADDGLVIVL
jgi:ribonuclease BN (tRNA processing enzyme)